MRCFTGFFALSVQHHQVLLEQYKGECKAARIKISTSKFKTIGNKWNALLGPDRPQVEELAYYGIFLC